MGNVFANLPATAGDGFGAAVDVSSMGRERTITVQDDFRGTVNIQFSNEGAAGPWATLLTFNAGGKKTVEIAARFMRVERKAVPNVDPGLPNVDVAANDNGGQFVDLPATAGDGIGASIDVSALGTFNTVTVLDDFTGTVIIEISEDGTDWSECMTFQSKGWQSKEFVAQFMRVKRKNVLANNPGLPNIDVGAINDSSPGSTVIGNWNITGPFTAAGAPHALACGDLAQADMSAGAFVFGLPAISAANAGCQITVKKIAGGGVPFTLDPAGANTVEGAATLSVIGPLTSITVVSDGVSNWMVI